MVTDSWAIYKGLTLWIGQCKKDTWKVGEMKWGMRSGKDKRLGGHSVPCNSPQCYLPSRKSGGGSPGPGPIHREKQ